MDPQEEQPDAHAAARERRSTHDRRGMQVSGRSTKSVLPGQIAQMKQQIASSHDFLAQLSGHLNLGDLYRTRSESSTRKVWSSAPMLIAYFATVRPCTMLSLISSAWRSRTLRSSNICAPRGAPACDPRSER